MLNLILFGPPGSGKGTQAAMLVEKYNLVHISTGDLFRYEIGNSTPLGLEAKGYMNEGKLVPDQVTIGMLKNKVLANTEAQGFIFDGFPRTIAQSEALDRLMEELGQSITTLILLEVDDEEIVQRLLNRGKTSGRADDTNEEVIRNRMAVFRQETSPVFEYYDKQHKALAIAGMGEIEEIFDNLCCEINKHL
jgi:adenylate kinase